MEALEILQPTFKQIRLLLAAEDDVTPRLNTVIGDGQWVGWITTNRMIEAFSWVVGGAVFHAIRSLQAWQ